jgi:hypothetical protein
MRLSEACHLVPSSLHVKGVELLEKEAIHGGGFAEIYRASYRNGTVALKSLRAYTTDKERRKVHQVSYSNLATQGEGLEPAIRISDALPRGVGVATS